MKKVGLRLGITFLFFLFLLSPTHLILSAQTSDSPISGIAYEWKYSFPQMVIGPVYITPTEVYVVTHDSNSIHLFAFSREGKLLWDKQIASYSEKLLDFKVPLVSPQGRYIAWPLQLLLRDDSQNVHVVTVGTYLIRYDGTIISVSDNTKVSGVTDTGEILSEGHVFGDENTIYLLNHGTIVFKNTQGQILNEYPIANLNDNRLILPLGNYLLISTYNVQRLFIGISGNIEVYTNQTPVISDVYLFNERGTLLANVTVKGIVSTATVNGNTLVLATAYSPEMAGKISEDKWIRANSTRLNFVNLATFSITELGIAQVLLPWTSGLLYSQKMDIVVGALDTEMLLFKPTKREFKIIRIGGQIKAVKEGLIAVVNEDSLYMYSTQDLTMSTLNVYSKPDTAEVYVDGVYQGVTPLSLRLLPGTHSVSITKQDYRNYTATIVLSPGESKTISVTLTPTFGYLSVSSSPPEANVYVDGFYEGQTPLNDYKLSTGQHEVRLKKDGYRDYSTTVTIEPGETTKVEVNLSQKSATLRVDSDPLGAEIYVDGSPKGATPTTLQLSPGTHSIKLTKEDYQDYTTTVTLNPGERKSLSITLKPAYGYLNVDSTPSGAEVYVDGSYAGKTPLNAYKVSPGEHTVEVKKDGYKTYTKKITVSAGEKASVSANLVMITTTKTTSTHTKSSSSTSYSSSVTSQSSTTPTNSSSTTSPKLLYAIGALIILVVIGGGVAVKTMGKSKSPEPSEPQNRPKFVPGFPPELLEKYEPLEFLGEGGFAKVFKVRRKRDGKIIALKLSNLDEKAKKFFLKEVKAWRLLDHPNIVKLYNAFDEPVPHLEIEFVDGVKLEGEVIRDLGKYPKPADEKTALNLVTGIAEGLKHAHSKQVFHRDLKPQNVLITSNLTPKITDWGLAKVGAVSTTATTTKGLTLLYAAPEQLDEDEYGHTDARTDIYQLGLIFYELLTGKLPYTGTSPAVVMAKVINPEVKPKLPSHYNKELAKYDGIFEKLLAKRKEDRYQSVEEFLEDLELLQKLEDEKRKLAEEIERTKTTMSLTTNSKELKKLRRQLVEQLSRNALLHAQLNDKAGLINALEDLKTFSREHRGELENAISQFEVMMRESVPISRSTIDELRVLLHKVEKEVEE